jgi:hypothetical protein
MNLCIDCRYCKKELVYCVTKIHVCTHPDGEKRVDYVTGKKEYFLCETMRNEGECRNEGIYFERKKK